MSDDDKINILVIDDMPDKLLSIQAVLEELRQNVVCATSGRDALRALLEQDFALILLDVNMPDMDGFETATLIRQRKKSQHTPIIFLTAFSDEDCIWQGYSLGAVDYILTPVVPEVLRAKVSVFVDLYRKTEQVKRHARHEVELVREQAARAAAEEATRRSDFLSQASRSLARSLDLRDTVSTLLRTPMPFLSEASLIVLQLSATDERQILITMPQADGFSELAVRPDELAPDLVTAIDRVLAEGGCELLTSRELMRFQGSAHSMVLAPLLGRGHMLGVLGLIRGPLAATFHPADVRLAEELAGRGALAIDNARLYHEIQEGDRRKEEFLAMLSHELRNPLGAINSALAVLTQSEPDEQAGELAAAAQAAQSIMDRQLRQMQRLVDDLLDVSRITRGKIELRKEVIDLRSVVSQSVMTVDPFIRERQHELRLELPSAAVLVHADSARLEQVVTNLLSNAAKYTEPGGKIRLRLLIEDDQAVLSVRDTGLGIPGDMLPKVFDLFVQGDRSLDRSQGGLGIGLTLVKSLVAMHRGTIAAFSGGANEGSEFVLHLPLTRRSEPRRALPDDPAAGIAAARGGHRILLVDDNADLLEMLRLLLARLGHEVHTAGDGPTAIQKAEQLVPDFALVDIGLPGMSGFDVARALRQIDTLANLVLVAMTGYGQADDRRKTSEAGFNHHLVKPVAFSQLQELLQTADLPAQASL